ncbi:hypothetical protein HYV49_02295 [Candidatus Pacearchaeota archaeon]|nr:hypothetical protein [Candidatus Pacearchaeota archaeon]
MLSKWELLDWMQRRLNQCDEGKFNILKPALIIMTLSDRHHEIVDLLKEEYKDLQRLNPKHELLSLIEITEYGFEVVKREEFERRFMVLPADNPTNNLYYRTFAVIKYKRAIRKAVREELESKLEQQELLEMVRRYF